MTCKRGHEFTPENTYLRPDNGYRQCRECIRLRAAAKQDKHNARRREMRRLRYETKDAA